MDEDVVLALFEPPKDDGPMVVVFFSMSDHQSTLSLNVVKPLTIPNNRVSNL